MVNLECLHSFGYGIREAIVNPCVTIKREEALQRWPVEKNAPLRHAVNRRLEIDRRGQSSVLATISSCIFFIGSDAMQACAMRRPVATSQ
jgi:hypothetical protein